jgi:hypothetical protein
MSPTDCGAPLCVIKKARERGGQSPRWAAEPEKIIIIHLYINNVKERLNISEETDAREVSFAHRDVLSKNKTLFLQIDLKIH